MNILEIKNLCKVYGTGETKVDALKNVSFDVEQGEFVAIVGPSGSGKSTLLHILGGVDSPTSGEVIISGTDISKLDETKLAIFRRRQIGLIYQFYNLIPILNVEENMTLPILLDGKKPDQAVLSDLVAFIAFDASSESAVRGPAAEGVYRAGAHEPSGPSFGGRTDRQP